MKWREIECMQPHEEGDKSAYELSWEKISVGYKTRSSLHFLGWLKYTEVALVRWAYLSTLKQNVIDDRKLQRLLP